MSASTKLKVTRALGWAPEALDVIAAGGMPPRSEDIANSAEASEAEAEALAFIGLDREEVSRMPVSLVLSLNNVFMSELHARMTELEVVIARLQDAEEAGTEQSLALAAKGTQPDELAPADRAMVEDHAAARRRARRESHRGD